MNIDLLMLICSAISFFFGAFPIIHANINWMSLGAMFYILSLLL